MLYWQYFYQLVKYRPLVEKYLNGEIDFRNMSSGKFCNLIQILSSFNRKPSLTAKVTLVLRRIYSLIVQIRNMLVLIKW